MIKYKEYRLKERRKYKHLRITLGLLTLEVFKLRNHFSINLNFSNWDDRRK